MKKIWTPISAAIVLTAMTGFVLLTPVNFVIWAPGPATDLLAVNNGRPVIDITGVDPHGSSGSILSTSMVATSQDSTVTLPTLIISYILPNRAVMPRDAVYSPGQNLDEAQEARRTSIETSREQAMAAGVRQAGIEVIEGPKVLTVRPNGPANAILLPGDFIVAIDGTPMSTENDVRQYIRNNKQVGDQVVVTVLRLGQTQILTVPKLQGSSTDGTLPTMGTTIGTGYLYTPNIRLNIDASMGDPSQGLALALATFDLLTASDHIQGSVVAAAGRISASGEVTAVEGINEHAASAASASATIMIIARDNCADITGRFPDLSIVPVTTLQEAVEALTAHSKGDLPTC